jgi:hypothetical protein
MKSNKDFLILDQQLAGLLMLKRHRLVTARPDKNDKTKNVFFFDYNNKFEEDFQILKKNKYKIEQFINELKK